MTERRTPHGNLSSEEAAALEHAAQLALQAIAGRQVTAALDDDEQQISRGED